MELKDVQFGCKHKYYEWSHQTTCYVVASHVHDGACLIVELYRDGDLTGEYVTTEACHLQEWDAYQEQEGVQVTQDDIVEKAIDYVQGLRNDEFAKEYGGINALEQELRNVVNIYQAIKQTTKGDDDV